MRILPLVLLCTACSITSSTDSTQVVETTEESDSFQLQAQKLEPINLANASFYSEEPTDRRARGPLELKGFDVSITTAPGTLRTRMDVVIRNPAKGQKQARIRVPIPSNAAVTEAILFVGDKPMRGAFLGANRAEQVYKSYTQRRRDPLLAVWGGPNWVDLQIFPVEGEQTRRFQLEWVEPRVTFTEMHRLPLLANAGIIVGSPGQVLVNGQSVKTQDGTIALEAPSARVVSVRPPGGALGYVLASGERPIESKVVFVAETSAHMTLEHRAKQRRDIESVLAVLPSSTRVTLLSADWLTKKIVADKSPAVAMAALGELDDIISAGSLDVNNTFVKASELAKETGAHSMVFFGNGQSGYGADAYKSSMQVLKENGLSLFVIASKTVSPEIKDMARRTSGRILSANDPRLAQLVRHHGTPPEVSGVKDWTVLDSAYGDPLWMGHFLGDRPAASTSGSVGDLRALWARSQVYAHDANKFLRGGHEVLTPETSILVLENDREYQRWSIPVPAAVAHSQDEPTSVAHGKAEPVGVAEGQGGVWRFFRGWRTSSDSRPTRAQAEDSTRPSGVLGILNERTGRFESTTASGFSSGADDMDVYGALWGNQVGEMSGGWGYGISGVGAGGGGTGWGTIGAGVYGTIGHGSGTGWGTIGAGVYGTIGHGGGSGMRGNKAQAPKVVLENGTVSGGLDKSILRRYVRRKMPRIRHCFEKELLVEPGLSGMIYTVFQITPMGGVQGVKARGINNRNVESCVAAAITSIQFPKPVGGGFVNVRYPFAFHNSGIATRVVSPLVNALAAFDKGERAQQLSEKLGVDFKSEAMLAWWILKEKVQSFSIPQEGVVLAAVLLHNAGDEWNSRRVFSQIGPAVSTDTLERLRSMGFEADAERLAGL